MVLYMEVTRDKYELPVAVADSISELAKMVGVSAETVRSAMCHCSKNNWKCSYIRVEVE